MARFSLQFRVFGFALCLLTVSPLHSPAKAAELRKVRPDAAGLSTERLNRLDPVMQAYVDESKLAGLSLSIMRNGKIAHTKHYGMADKERGLPIADDTIYRIHSMTKPVTSVALMMLYEEGRFQLSDPIAMYIPELADLKIFDGVNFDGTLKVREAHRQPTIQDLLTHTAGFSSGRSTDPISKLYQERKYRDRENGTLREMIERIADVPLLYQPGERWFYSISSDIQAYLVEVLSGQSFDVFLRTRIFEPLEMHDTGFHVPPGKAARFAAAYGHKDGALVLADDPQASTYLKKPKFFSGSGGLVSTTNDYLRFLQAMLTGGALDGARILSPKTVELMTQNHLTDGVTLNLGSPSSQGYGLGFAVRTTLVEDAMTGSVGEFYWEGSASTYFWADPEEDLIAILMTQFYPSNGHRIRQQFHALVYGAVVD